MTVSCANGNSSLKVNRRNENQKQDNVMPESAFCLSGIQ